MNLKKKILQGGIHLIARQLIGMILSLLSIFLVTRIIGAESYGIYAISIGIVSFSFQIMQLGIGVYLLRGEDNKIEEDYHQSFSILLIISIITIIIASIASDKVSAFINIYDTKLILHVMFVAMVLQLLTIVPLAKLERSLNYKTIVTIELAGQVIFLLVAVPLSWKEKGAWAPTYGWITQQCFLFILVYWKANYIPRLIWKKERVLTIISYGIGYSTSMWIWLSRQLVNPLIIAKFAGAEAAGIVALTVRLTDILAFVKSATWRLSIASLSKVQGDKNRLINATEKGLTLQIIALAPILLIFSLITPLLIKYIFGNNWSDVVILYPFIATGIIINAIFSLHSSALYVLRYNGSVTIFHSIYILLFTGTAWLSTPHFGILGYGLAELVAILSYTVIHNKYSKYIGHLHYGIAIWWALAFSFALFWSEIGLIALLPITITLLLPKSKETLRSYFIFIKGTI